MESSIWTLPVIHLVFTFKALITVVGYRYEKHQLQ